VAAATLREGRVQTGVRPFNPRRDVGAVAELVAAAFGDSLDPAEQVALTEMRRTARWSPLLWWLHWPTYSVIGMTTPGFVWVEEGCVVGNISLRRALGWGGFFIGNVAVHPDWQGRGIASALMGAALDEIVARGGRWVGLEVRADSQVARRLYERAGFSEIGRTLHMLRPAGLARSRNQPPHPLLRRGRSRDSAALIELVQATVPESQRPLLELRREDYQLDWQRTLDHWLEGRHEAWWVVEENGAIRGAVRALRERGRCPDRLEVLIAAEHRGRFESVLVQQGIADLRGAPRKLVEAMLPAPEATLVAALEAADFQEARLLVQMRLDLTHHISVAG
jgi:ribosomal protein S18 acetylase RimI-like enzyme